MTSLEVTILITDKVFHSIKCGMILISFLYLEKKIDFREVSQNENPQAELETQGNSSDLYNSCYHSKSEKEIIEFFQFFQTGKVITLQKIRNIDAAILKEIALRSPRHLSVIDCHGNIPTPDIVNFFSNGGQHIEVSVL